MHALDAALDQAEHHRARRAAGAQHQRVVGGVPARCAGVEIIDEAFDVGVGRAQFALLVPQRVGGADRARPRVRPRQRQRALLVRKGDVGADEAVARQMQHEFGKSFRRHRLDVVAALDAERAQPVMMDQRRARMRCRPPDQACGGGFGRRSSSPSLRTSRVLSDLIVKSCKSVLQVNASGGSSRHDRAQRQCPARGKPDRGEVDPVIGERAAHPTRDQRRPQQEVRHPAQASPPVSATATNWPTLTSAPVT